MVDMTPFNSELARRSGRFEEVLEKVLLGAVTKTIDSRENVVQPVDAVEAPTNS